MLVGLDEASGVLASPLIKGVLVEDDLQLVEVNGDWVLTDYYPRVVLN